MAQRLTDFIDCARDTESTLDELASIVGDPKLADDHEKLINRVAMLTAKAIAAPELAGDINTLIERMKLENRGIKRAEGRRERALKQQRPRQTRSRRRHARKGPPLTKGHEAA